MKQTQVTIHQPTYLPYPGFFNKVKNSQVFIIFDKAEFKKNYFFQRNKIKTPEGWRYLNIPISKKFHHKPINEVKFLEKGFKKKHRAIIHQYYYQTPYYKNYVKDLNRLFENNTNYLSDFNIEIIKYIMQILGLKAKIILSSKLDVDFSLKGTDINLALLKAVGATHYLSGPMGKEYLDLNQLKQAGITVTFQDYKPKKYAQLYSNFIPNLSIIDMLFNLGKDTSKYI